MNLTLVFLSWTVDWTEFSLITVHLICQSGEGQKNVGEKSEHVKSNFETAAWSVVQTYFESRTLVIFYPSLKSMEAKQFISSQRHWDKRA